MAGEIIPITIQNTQLKLPQLNVTIPQAAKIVQPSVILGITPILPASAPITKTSEINSSSPNSNIDITGIFDSITLPSDKASFETENTDINRIKINIKKAGIKNAELGPDNQGNYKIYRIIDGKKTQIGSVRKTENNTTLMEFVLNNTNYEMEYDSNNNLISKVRFYYKDGEKIYEYIEKSQFDLNNNCTYKKTTSLCENGKTVIHITENEFGQKNNLISTTNTYIKNNQTETICSRYDENDNCTYKNITFIDEDGKTTSDISESEFDSQHRMTYGTRILTNDGAKIIEAKGNLKEMNYYIYQNGENIHKFELPTDKYTNRIFILMKNNIDETIKLADSGLFDLIKSGQLDISVLNQIYSRKDANRFVSDMTFDNIKKIHSDQTIVKHLSSETDLKNISTHINNGEVCEINGKLYCNNNGNAIQLNLSKESFEELFPPLIIANQRTELSMLKDCWLISRLNICNEKAAGRIYLYQMFEEDNDGNITVKLPNQKPVIFPKGELPKASIGVYTNQPALKYIEFAYAANNIEEIPTDIISMDDIILKGDDILRYLEAQDDSPAGHVAWYKAITKQKQSFAAKLQEFQIKNSECENWLKKAADDNIGIICSFYISSQTDTPETEAAYKIARKYELFMDSFHDMAIESYDKENQIVYIKNPVFSQCTIKMPLEDFKKLSGKIYIMQF